MSDSTKVNDFSDKLLEAMSIISESKLYNMQYDKTITCTITNDEKRADGEYEVSDGSIKFKAYSSNDNYRTKDVVYVTIPQGDYDNEKIIIGKKTDETLKPITYQQPFDKLFDMTGNILPKEQIVKGSLLANDISYTVNSETEEINITDENIVQGGTKKHLIELKDLSLTNYTHLGLKADFKSWISKAATGNYGLKMTITADNPNVVADNANAQQQTTEEYVLTLDNSEMYGNSYNYETFYTQEIVFNIQEKIKGTITKISLDFYQLGNFKDIKDEDIPSLSVNGNKKERLLENLSVENIYLCLGYDINRFDGDYVEIYTKDTKSYVSSTSSTDNTAEKNKKSIEMRWVHIGEDGKPIDMIKKIENETETKTYKVYWYRYRVGAAAADTYSGVYWEKIIGASGFKYNFSPDVNKQQEKIKAIILYDNNEIYRSNELVFENQKNVPLDKEAEHILNALQIVVDDGTSGNYLVYGQNNSIKDSAEGDKIRTLSAKFDANSDGVHESDVLFDKLTWTFPENNSMIEPVGTITYEKIVLLPYSFNNYYINQWNEEKKAYEMMLGPEEFDPTLTYYIKIDEENYVPVENAFYQSGVYYEKIYTKQNTSSSFNSSLDYYELKDEQYVLVKEPKIESLSNYYTLFYSTVSGDYDQDKDYYKKETNTSKKIGRPQYKIAKYYSGAKTNNTIVCEYNLNGVIYRSEITFTFGKAGTMGTDQTIVIDFVGDINAITINDSNNVYNMTVRVYDKENKEIKDISNISWSWFYPIENDETKDSFKLQLDKRSQKQCTITEKGVQHGDLYIIKVEVGNLETYFPIPLKSSDVSYIEGPSEVIYMSDGTIDYYNVPYKAIGIDGLDKECEWKTVPEYSEKLKNYIGTIMNKQLKPLGIYVKDAPVYGVMAYKTADDGTQIYYWTQPILVLQNQWPSSVLNKWDGKTLEINTNEGYILANAISAGKKNANDNTFSGVVLGDWSKTDTEASIAKQTGVYGFHHGAMSYAFKEDGTAFIGKDGKGRIEFNGNKGTIQSASWGTPMYPQMQIDLDDTKIEMYGSEYDYIKIDTNSDYPIQLSGSMRIELEDSYIGHIGEITANIPESGTDTIDNNTGVGLKCLNGFSEISALKATNQNVGMCYTNGGYISIGKKGLSIGSTSLSLYCDNTGTNNDSKIILDKKHIGMHISGGGWISLYGGEDTTNKNTLKIGGNTNFKIYFVDVDAKNQHGIYARFA